MHRQIQVFGKGGCTSGFHQKPYTKMKYFGGKRWARAPAPPLDLPMRCKVSLAVGSFLNLFTKLILSEMMLSKKPIDVVLLYDVSRWRHRELTSPWQPFTLALIDRDFRSAAEGRQMITSSEWCLNNYISQGATLGSCAPPPSFLDSLWSIFWGSMELPMNFLWQGHSTRRFSKWPPSVCPKL